MTTPKRERKERAKAETFIEQVYREAIERQSQETKDTENSET
jgi:hypothetical protein